MSPPSRATVEDDNDDPYAPYSERTRSSGSSRAAHSSASSSTSAPSSDDTRQPPNTNPPIQSSQGEEEDEPLFGGRPFLSSHSDSPSTSNDESLYALLNVSKSATPTQIKESYKSLAIILHPDKHTDPNRKLAAESSFRQVQRAYEILMDQEKRAVYDHFGQEGLNSSWTVSLRGKSPQEMRQEFEREKRRQQAQDAEGLVKSKGDFTAMVDASALFLPLERLPRPYGSVKPLSVQERLNRVGCTQLIGKHGFETQMTNSTSLHFAGQMISRGGMGGGNLVGTVKTHWSPRLFSQVSMTLLRPQILTTKGQFTLDANSFFTWQTTSQTLALPPTLNLTYGQRLSSQSNLTGFTCVRSGTYTLGPWGKNLEVLRGEPTAVSVGLTAQKGRGKGWTIQSSVSSMDQSIGLDYSTVVLSGLTLRNGINLGTGSGVTLFTTTERRITESLRLGLGLDVSLPGGVSLKIKLNRLGQKIILPILLAPEYRGDLVMAFTVIPAVGMTALHYLYLMPRKRRRMRNRLEDLRRENDEMIQERRKAASQAREVLKDQARKKEELEKRSNGLVILQAWYGRKEAFPTEEGGEEEEYWNVKIPLQALVNKSQLVIPGGRSKSNILGFHDPILGERKHLYLCYSFRGSIHQTIISDTDPLAAPLRTHQI